MFKGGADFSLPPLRISFHSRLNRIWDNTVAQRFSLRLVLSNCILGYIHLKLCFSVLYFEIQGTRLNHVNQRAQRFRRLVDCLRLVVVFAATRAAVAAVAPILPPGGRVFPNRHSSTTPGERADLKLKQIARRLHMHGSMVTWRWCAAACRIPTHKDLAPGLKHLFAPSLSLSLSMSVSRFRDTLNTPFFKTANGADPSDFPYAPIPTKYTAGGEGTTYKWPLPGSEGYYSVLYSGIMITLEAGQGYLRALNCINPPVSSAGATRLAL